MASSRIVFVSSNLAWANAARDRFLTTTRGMGLAWQADAFVSTDALPSNPRRVIVIDPALSVDSLKQNHPEIAELLEVWPIAEGEESQLHDAVMDLFARLLGGGGTAPPPKPKPEAKPRKLTAKVGRETAGRRGKGVTTIFELPLNQAEIQELAALLKQKCGTGGTVKDKRIEIQGDQRDRIVAELEKLGYRVKRSGG